MKGTTMKSAFQGFTTLCFLRRIALAAMVAASTLLVAANSAAADPFDRLWVFGDSTVDTGWYNFRRSGGNKFDQFLFDYTFARPRNDPPTYNMGKPTSSPGPVSVEVLARLIGTEALPADKIVLPHPLLASQTPQNSAVVGEGRIGTNYASGGARNH